MKLVTSLQDYADRFQQKNPVAGFLYAVIAKYNDDDGPRLAGLIAYYGFLSLFPILIAATIVVQIIAQQNPELRQTLLDAIATSIPAIGEDLLLMIDKPSQSGWQLVLALLIALYGARGVAGAVQSSLNQIWAVPRKRRASFPKSGLKNLAMILYGGTGLLIALTLVGYASGSSQPSLTRLLAAIAGSAALFASIWGVFTFGSSAKKRPFANIPGALVATILVSLLQALGGYLIARQLKVQAGLGTQLAMVLAIMFWFYLQAQLFLIAAEINAVRVYKLKPRGLDQLKPTAADKKAHELYARRDSYTPGDENKD